MRERRLSLRRNGLERQVLPRLDVLLKPGVEAVEDVHPLQEVALRERCTLSEERSLMLPRGCQAGADLPEVPRETLEDPAEAVFGVDDGFHCRLDGGRLQAAQADDAQFRALFPFTDKKNFQLFSAPSPPPWPAAAGRA